MKWDKQFIDRTEKKNRLEPLRKKLILKSLGIYWNSDTKMILCDLSQEKATAKMKDLVLKDDATHDELNYLISISANSKLVQKSLKDPNTKDDPNLFLELVLQPLNVNLQKAQLEDIIRLLEYLTAYLKFKADCAHKQEEGIKHISEQEKKAHIQRFKVMFEKMQRSEKKDDFKGEEKIRQTLVDPNDVKEFKYLIQAIPDEDLTAAVKEVVRALELERQKKEIEEKKSSRGFFSMFSSKKKDAVISQEEVSQLESFLDKTLKGDSEEDTSEQFASQKNLALSFLLEGGNISLFDQTPDKTIEGVSFGYRELKADVELRNKGQKVQVSLKDINLALRTKYLGAKDFVVTPIMQKLDYSMDKFKPFLVLGVDINPIGLEDGIYINLDWQALEFIYRPLAIQRLTNFFDVKTTDEALKAAAREQLDKAQDSAANAAGDAYKSTTKTKINISANLASPVIIVPFLQTGDVKSPCWIMQLGDLAAQTGDSDHDKYYDNYNIKLTGINFKYYPSQVIYIKSQQMLSKTGKIEHQGADQVEYSAIFPVLEDVQIDVNLKTAAASAQAKDRPRVDVNVNVSGIHLRLKPQIYTHLLKTADYLALPHEAQVEFQENDRKVLVQGMEKMGRLYHQEKKFSDTVWVVYFVILKGGYLYFFKNPTDNQPTFATYIKSGKVTLNPEAGREGAFTVIC